MEDKTIDLIPVEGHSSLGRDADSNAILNTDTGAYNAYIKARENAKQKDRTLDDLKKEVDDLKDLVRDLIQKEDK
tara:strand:+ start:282 stop:506 length:225 start_codon:yes stop_codon:yes gene_type:complete